MAYIFGDGFDCYATLADAVAGYWDSFGNASQALATGRFAGSRAWRHNPLGSPTFLTKASNVNDAVHHLIVAVYWNAAVSGTANTSYLQLLDGVTAQCSIILRQDGAILLTSGGTGGTVLATYTGAVTAQGVWTAFEFEVVIHNTAGSFTVRKNGNTSNDFTLGSLNTRGGTTNNYANKLTLGAPSAAFDMSFDDLLWRSDASSVPFVGDIRCYTRMPASDASVQFAKSPVSLFAQGTALTSGSSNTANVIRTFAVAAPTTGTLLSLTYNIGAGVTGHVKMALYDATGASGGPGALLASSAELTNPAAGVNTFAVTAGPALTKGTTYHIAIWHDVAITHVGASANNGNTLAVTYTSAFPGTLAGFSLLSINGFGSQGMNVAPTNAALVNEAQQDGTTSYVYDSTVGHADFYNLAPLAVTPASVVAVVTRGFVEKSDAGTRTGAVQLKSGGTTVASAAPALSTSFGWLWRADTVDPATGSAWTAAGVNGATIGPSVVS